jgi:hypothetical protein
LAINQRFLKCQLDQGFIGKISRILVSHIGKGFLSVFWGLFWGDVIFTGD